MSDLVRPCERVDDLQLNGYKIIQNPAYFCFGSDAVALSDFTLVRKNERVMDLCTGTGIIPVLLCAKTPGRNFTGLELLPECAEMARRSVLLNGLQERITIDQGDLKQAPARYGAGVFNVVTVNPPYMNDGGGIPSGSDALAVARHETACTLDDVVSVSARLLTSGGRLYMVHRPHRLVDVFSALRAHKLEPKALQMVQSAAHKNPSLALIEAALDGKPWLKVLPPRIIGV